MNAVQLRLSQRPLQKQLDPSFVVGRDRIYSISKGKFSSTRGLLTEDANACTIGALLADNRTFLFHVAPEQQPLNALRNELEKKIDILKDTCSDIAAFICGGLRLNNADSVSVNSFTLYNNIADVLDELGIKFGMMCGKEKGSPCENMYAKNKHLDIWSGGYKDIAADMNTDRKEVIQRLEKYYDIVEIPDDMAIQFEK